MNEIPLKGSTISYKAINPSNPNSVRSLPTTRLKCPKCQYGRDNADEHINQRPPIPNDPKGQCECPKCHHIWQTNMNRTDDKLKVLTNSIDESFNMIIFKSPEILATFRQQPKFQKKLNEMLKHLSK